MECTALDVGNLFQSTLLLTPVLLKIFFITCLYSLLHNQNVDISVYILVVFLCMDLAAVKNFFVHLKKTA